MIEPHPFTAWQTVLDPLLTPGMRNYWKSHDFLELSDGLIDVLIEHARRIPDPQTEIAFAQLGGAVSRVPADATAYAHRDAQFVMNVHGRWEDPAKDAACIGWARQLFEAAAPFATGGVYVNFLTQDEQGRVPAAYGGNYARLVALKKKYDPGNLFRVNQNIGPAAEGRERSWPPRTQTMGGGAGYGNRTRLAGLGSQSITTMLSPPVGTVLGTHSSKSDRRAGP